MKPSIIFSMVKCEPLNLLTAIGTFRAVNGADLSLQQSGNALSGSIAWTGGPNPDDRTKASTVSGSVGDVITLNRVDTAGSTLGLKAVFLGSVSADGNSMSGVGGNDPSSPNGNGATYAWTGQRQ